MSDDTPYEGLNEDSDDHRWAFGTGFTDPLQGIDTTVPAGLDAETLATYCLMLGDDALIYSHRLQQWMTRMPELEEETALANIALDLLGQARMLLARAAGIEGTTEDALAYFREEREYRNVRLVERLDEDFAELVGRLLIFSSWRLALFDKLAESRDPVLSAIAAKSVKELTYHRDYAAQWVVRLGDGTELSRKKMQAALETIWPLVDELFQTSLDPSIEPLLDRGEVDIVLDTVFATSTLDRPTLPAGAAVAGRTGRDGVHTEALGYVLTELQAIARQYPDAQW
ncbi:MAG TPA: 1,2-phenylacetyl-CoA epoxidase subunit PaaC [Jatrophihabitantaceae bacterium]|jgi:ring-1,2-phenylacetyl-CoA epoxidase subunit PaaC|nr:1,2-phenylacetyl-CoA epoxidase subunit PaaC [Jatrophihabitantaceae bacterium]